MAVDAVTQFPECRKCGKGSMLPLSDYGRDGAPIVGQGAPRAGGPCTSSSAITST